MQPFTDGTIGHPAALAVVLAVVLEDRCLVPFEGQKPARMAVFRENKNERDTRWREADRMLDGARSRHHLFALSQRLIMPM